MLPELQVMRAPARTYRLWVDDGWEVSPLGALYRPAVVGLLMATTVAITATGHLTAGLVATLICCWGFVVVLQVIAGLAVTVRSNRRVGVASALDLLFVAHAPWSFWLLAVAVWTTARGWTGHETQVPLMTMLVPFAWTLVLLHAFCRTVLDCTSRAAVRRTIAHQAIVWGIGLLIASLAVQLWPRVIGLFE